MHVTIQLASRSIDHDYLVRCARIRDITISKLIRKLFETIVRDQLVLAVLDDDGRPHKRGRHDHRFHTSARAPCEMTDA